MGRRGAHCIDDKCPAPSRVGHWSHMDCNDTEDHQNHDWSSEYTVYGPYWCQGVGVQVPPADPSEKQYTNNPVAAYIVDGDLESMRYRADITDDDVVWERTVSYSQWKRVPRDTST